MPDKENMIKESVFEEIDESLKNEKLVISSLKDILNHIDEVKETPEFKAFIAYKLQDAKDKEMYIAQEIEYILQINKRIENYEIGIFESVKRKMTMLSDKGKREYKQMLNSSRKKIFAEERNVEEYFDDSSKFCKELIVCLNDIAKCIDSNEFEKAKRIVFKAIDIEEKTLGLMTQIKNFEIKLMGLLNMELIIG